MITKGELKLTIPRPNIQIITLTLQGTKPLIFHKWSEKAKQMIKDKQAKKAIANKRAQRDPEEEAEGTFYKDSEGKIAFPALCIKQSMVNAARNIEGVTMALLRGAIFVEGDKDGLLPVEYKEKTHREDMVRVGMGVADIRYRGQLNNWSIKTMLKFNADVISAEQVANLLQTAGFCCGLGEWRPEKNGDYGTFTVVN